MAITRKDELVAVTIDPTRATVLAFVRRTVTDSADGTATVETVTVEDDAAYNVAATQNYLAAALAVVNGVKAAGAPAITTAAKGS